MGKNTQQKAGDAILTRNGFAREFSSGGVIFKRNGGDVLWLVAASSPSKLYPEVRWRLPKGRIDDLGNDKPGPMARGEVRADEKSLQEGALREIREEAGVGVEITKKIGTSKFFLDTPHRGRLLKFVTYYLAEWVRDLPEGFGSETSEILWLPYDEARKKLSYSGEKKILDKAKELLASLA